MKTVTMHILLLAVCAIATVHLGAQTQQDDTAKAEAAKREGDRLAKTGDFTAAIASYDQAIQVDSKSTAAYKARAAAYRRLHQPERAIQDYDEAIRLDPEDAEIYFERAGAHATLQQFDAAIQDYDTAIEKKPDYANAYAARSGAKAQAGDQDGARADWAKATSLGYVPQRIRVGGNVAQAKLVRQPRPIYPPEAKMAGITGTVKLNAIIGKDGTILDLTLASGHPLLAPAAMDAVKQWVYQPTLLNGSPVEIVTQIDVTFTLSRR